MEEGFPLVSTLVPQHFFGTVGIANSCTGNLGRLLNLVDLYAVLDLKFDKYMDDRAYIGVI